MNKVTIFTSLAPASLHQVTKVMERRCVDFNEALEIILVDYRTLKERLENLDASIGADAVAHVKTQQELKAVKINLKNTESACDYWKNRAKIAAKSNKTKEWGCSKCSKTNHWERIKCWFCNHWKGY